MRMINPWYTCTYYVAPFEEVGIYFFAHVGQSVPFTLCLDNNFNMIDVGFSNFGKDIHHKMYWFQS